MNFYPDEWHNIAKSKRLIILGNGPSLLTQIDLLPKLKDEATMTCNGIRRWADLPFEPTYHCVTDIPLYKWLADALGSWKNTHRFAFHRKGNDTHGGFYTVPTEQDNVQIHSHGMAGMGSAWEDMRTGRTTPLTIAQLGWWMGYRELYYIGIEQSRGYAWAPGQTISVNGRADFPIDKNAKYLLAIQRSAVRMREEIEAKGGKIVDCTYKGFLNAQCIPPNSNKFQRMTENSCPIRAILPYEALEEVL